MLSTISVFLIPLIVLFIVIYGYIKKVDIYDVFIEGATESFSLIATMFPCILAMFLGINIFLSSDILKILSNLLNPLLEVFKIPFDIIPMMIMRPISGTSSLAILNSIYTTYGPDSYIGRLGSVIQGATDTTLYVLTLYYGSIGIKKIRYSLAAGILTDFIGILASVFIVKYFFG